MRLPAQRFNTNMRYDIVCPEAKLQKWDMKLLQQSKVWDMRLSARISHFKLKLWDMLRKSLCRQSHISNLILKWDLWADTLISHLSFWCEISGKAMSDLIYHIFFFWNNISGRIVSDLTSHSEMKSLGRQSHISYSFLAVRSLGRQSHISYLTSYFDIRSLDRECYF